MARRPGEVDAVLAVGYWIRSGDLLVEASDPRAARTFLELSAQVLGNQLDDDDRGRVFS